MSTKTVNSENHPAHDAAKPYCSKTLCSGWTLVTEAADVTEEILDLAEQHADGERDDRNRIDWESVFDRRLEGTFLADGTCMTLGSEYDTPAQRKIQREIRKRMR